MTDEEWHTQVVEEEGAVAWVRIIDGDDDPGMRFQILAQRSIDDPEVEVRILATSPDAGRVYIGRRHAFRSVPAVCADIVEAALAQPTTSPVLYRMVATLAAAVDEQAIARELFASAERVGDE